MLARALPISCRASGPLSIAASRARRHALRPSSRLSLLTLIVAFAFLTACIGAHAQALDVFGQPASATGAAASAPLDISAPPSWWSRNMSSAVRSAVGNWLHVQADFNARIEHFLAQWPHGASLAAWATLIVVAFGYGSLHALGPGHGKLVVSTYLGSRRARIGDAILLSAWTAIVQALSAIGLVLGAAWFAHAGLISVMPRAASMEIISYALLCAASAWAIRSSSARDRCCDEPPAVKFPRGDETTAAATASATVGATSPGNISTDGADLRGSLGSISSARRDNASSPSSQTATRSRLWQIATLGLAAGARPCVGAIFALVTSMAVHAIAAGIAATFSMATGVATTVALIGLGSIGANRTLSRLALRYRFRSSRVNRALAIGAIGAILLFSALQLALLVSGVATASFY